MKWCPFKRSKDYYRTIDLRYLHPSDKMIYKIGKILSNRQNITCNDCPKIINKNLSSRRNEPSMFQPLLNYMMNEIN